MPEKFNGFSYVTPNAATSHEVKCGNCGNNVGAIEVSRYNSTTRLQNHWLICPVCSYGIVFEHDGKIFPAIKYGEPLEGLPKEVESAYNEARECMSINAFTACQLLCRKILMHIAVDKCKGKEGDSFENYIKNIQQAGYITPPMKQWVDKIRQEGNVATHKLEPPSPKDTENIMNFTTQLLKLVYEMEYKAKKFSSTTDSK